MKIIYIKDISIFRIYMNSIIIITCVNGFYNVHEIFYKRLDKIKTDTYLLKIIESELTVAINEMKEFNSRKLLTNGCICFRKPQIVKYNEDVIKNISFALENLKKNKNYPSIKNVLKIILE